MHTCKEWVSDYPYKGWYIGRGGGGEITDGTQKRQAKHLLISESWQAKMVVNCSQHGNPEEILQFSQKMILVWL